METKFTKGKWEVTPYQNVYCGINRVCTIGDLVEVTEEVKANALLISKAPEMFEMLESFINDFDNGLIEDYQIPRDRFQKLLKEATEL